MSGHVAHAPAPLGGRRPAGVAALAAVLIVAVLAPRTAAQSQFGDADAEPVPFGPQMGALMSMVIQPRHAKLGLAGKAQNWELAGYMLKELRQGVAVPIVARKVRGPAGPERPQDLVATVVDSDPPRARTRSGWSALKSLTAALAVRAHLRSAS